MSTSRKRFGLKVFAFSAVALMFLSNVYLINDVEQGDAASYTYNAREYSTSSDIETTFYVGDTLTINGDTYTIGTAPNQTRYYYYVASTTIPGFEKGTSHKVGTVTYYDYTGVLTTAGTFGIAFMAKSYKGGTPQGYNTKTIGVTVKDPIDIDFSASNSYGTVNKSTISIGADSTTISVSSNKVTVNGTTCTATPAANTAQYTHSFSKWEYSTNGGSTWSNLSNNQSITGDASIRAVFTRSTNSYEVKYYSGSSQITSYTENVQYNGHITHASYSVSGKVFCGWYKSSSSFTSANLVTTSTAVTGALTLYAYMVDTIAFTSSPVANATITYASDLGCVLFDALESQSPAKVLWDFGDGTYGHELVEYHHYEEPGTYNVKLSVFNYSNDVDTREYVVTVYDAAYPPEKSDNTLLIVGCTAAVILASIAIIRPF